jgi:hypothetical protein
VTPSDALRWFLTIWFSTLAGLIAFRILTGQIVLAGLLTMDGQKFSPERLQLLIFTIAGLAAFAASALAQHKLPAIPEDLLVVFAASQSVFLGGKIAGR